MCRIEYEIKGLGFSVSVNAKKESLVFIFIHGIEQRANLFLQVLFTDLFD